MQKNYTTKMDALVDKDTANKNELEFFHRLYVDEAKEEVCCVQIRIFKILF